MLMGTKLYNSVRFYIFSKLQYMGVNGATKFPIYQDFNALGEDNAVM